ncbi:MAG: hypothetical protein QM743_04670 [Chitinophagaceae bacterium]
MRAIRVRSALLIDANPLLLLPPLLEEEEEEEFHRGRNCFRHDQRSYRHVRKTDCFRHAGRAVTTA